MRSLFAVATVLGRGGGCDPNTIGDRFCLCAIGQGVWGVGEEFGMRGCNWWSIVERHPSRLDDAKSGA